MPELRAEIGKVASQIGIKAAAFRFTKRLGKHVNESTVRSIKKAYREALLIRRKSGKVKDEVLSSVHSQETWQAFAFREENRFGCARIHIETS